MNCEHIVACLVKVTLNIIWSFPEVPTQHRSRPIGFLSPPFGPFKLKVAHRPETVNDKILSDVYLRAPVAVIHRVERKKCLKEPPKRRKAKEMRFPSTFGLLLLVSRS